MKRKTGILMCLILLGSAAFTDEASLTRLFDLALQNSPELAALAAEVRAAEAEARSLMALMDPMLSFEYMELPLVAPEMGSGPMSEKKLSLTQTIPFPGKIAAQAQARSRAVQVRRLAFESALNRMKRDIAVMYYTIASTDKLIALHSARLSQLDALFGIVSARFQTSQASFSEYTKAKIMKSMAQNDLTMLRLERATMTATLARMAGLERLPENLIFDFEPLPSSIPQSAAQLVTQARASFPEAVLQSALVEKADAEAMAAAWELAPDTTLGVSLNLPDSGGTYLSFMVGISLPLYFFARQVPEIQAASSMQEAAVKRLAGTRNSLAGNISNSLEAIKSNREILRELDETVITEAHASLEVSNREYLTGKKDLRALLEEMTALYDYSAEAEKARLALYTNLAALHFYTGFTLPGPKNKGD